MNETPSYYLLGDGGTGLMKQVGSAYYYINDQGQWEENPTLIDYFVNGSEMKPVNQFEAKLWYADQFPLAIGFPQ